VFEATGRPLSVWQSEHGFRTPRYRAKLVAVRWPYERLLERIAVRTERALAAGWMDEVEDLARRGYREARAMSSVGYKQVLACLEGQLPRDELKVAIDRATKVFARKISRSGVFRPRVRLSSDGRVVRTASSPKGRFSVIWQQSSYPYRIHARFGR